MTPTTLPQGNIQGRLGAWLLALGALVLAGWTLDVSLLRSGWPGWPAMAPNTAVALAGCGGWLSLSGWNWPRVRVARTALALFVAAVGAATMAEYLTASDLGIDALLFRDTGGAVQSQAPGRMTFATALDLVLLGLSFFVLQTPRGFWFGQALAFLALSIALLALTGRAYNLEALYAVGAYTGIAAPTILGLLLAGAGALLTPGEHGLRLLLAGRGPGTSAARRLLPVAILLPLLLGWLRLAGQRIGLYEADFGVALFAVTTALLFVLVVWWTAALLERADEVRRRAEELVRLSQARLSLAQKAGRMGTFDWILPTGQVIWTPELEQLYGLPPGGFGGLYESWASTLHPEDREQAEAAARSAAQEGRDFEAEFRIVLPDGTVRWIQGNGTLLRDEAGVPARMVGINMDITRRKEAELDLVRSNAELERFASVASHDLQEPLRMVSSFTQLLAQRYRGRLDKDADEFIGYAVDGANRMQALINDLLRLSRVGTRGKPLEPTDARGVVERCLRDLSPAIDEAHAVIEVDPLPRVQGDPAQLGQLFQNLIANAVRFHGAQPPHIRVSAQPSGVEWIFSVRDNGIGIAPEHFERIFVMFQRLHTREEYPGTGIGLALCKKIVQRHGGRIWVESAPGKGATFKFTLPAEQRRAA